jgi:hypothetical protein
LDRNAGTAEAEAGVLAGIPVKVLRMGTGLLRLHGGLMPGKLEAYPVRFGFVMT